LAQYVYLLETVNISVKTQEHSTHDYTQTHINSSSHPWFAST